MAEQTQAEQTKVYPKPEPLEITRQVDGKDVTLELVPIQIQRKSRKGQWYLGFKHPLDAIVAFIGKAKIAEIVTNALNILAQSWWFQPVRDRAARVTGSGKSSLRR